MSLNINHFISPIQELINKTKKLIKPIEEVKKQLPTKNTASTPVSLPSSNTVYYNNQAIYQYDYSDKRNINTTYNFINHATPTLSKLAQTTSKLTSDATDILNKMWQDNADSLQNTVGLPTGMSEYSLDFLNSMTDELPVKNTLQQSNQQLDQLKNNISQKLEPVIANVLPRIHCLLDYIINWSQENPKLFSQLVKIAGAISVITIITGGLSTFIVNTIAPFAMLCYALSLLGIESLGIIASIRFVGTTILWLSRLLLTTPIGLIITGIATSALLIYRYWQPISEFFANLWGNIKNIFHDSLNSITGWLQQWSPLAFFQNIFTKTIDWITIQLPEQFRQAGQQIIHNFTLGITEKLHKLTKTLSSKLNKIKNIFSSSNEISVTNDIINKKNSLLSTSLSLDNISETSLPKTANQTYNTATPMKSDNITIHVHPTPGMNEQALAQAVKQQLTLHQQENNYAKLYDGFN